VSGQVSEHTTRSFTSGYQRALVKYVVAGSGEEGLMHAYELGRQAVAEERNILDLVALHQNIMLDVVLSSAGEAERESYRRRGEEFLAEVMAPFEMMHRGFTDTIQRLQQVNATLEQRVAERTRALRESQRATADLARLYQILSSINSTIVRIRDRGELLREACRIAVTQGGYPVAWINMRDKEGQAVSDSWCHIDEHGPVCRSAPVEAICGDLRGSLEQVYAEGRHLIRHRGSCDPDVWEHASRKYAAYVLLPLVPENEVVGVMALLSTDDSAFGETEMRLLLEMAGDLSFALEHIHKEEQLDYLAYYDGLTDLPNLSLLLQQLAVQCQAAARSGDRVALLLIDLMNFSGINDTYGRHTGDSLLKMIGARLREATGNTEMVARLGADVFGLTLTNIEQAAQVAHLLAREVLNCFSQSFLVDDNEVHVTVQVGISLFPSDGTDAETLYKNAEIALKRAKDKGETYLLYDAGMNERIVRSVTMEGKLRRAVEQDQLVLHYQPKVLADDGSLVGMEALLRYQDPEEGLIHPEQFVPLLEETGLIIEIGSWVLQRAADDFSRWCRLGLKPPRVAFNVSPIQLRQENFVQALLEALERSGGCNEGLDIEITESAVMQDVRPNIPKLEAVREMGFRIAVDDFGTGYSSLTYLSRLPVNSLKIDRSFIVDMTESPNSLAIVNSILSLAHSLRLEVVAEGVENEEQAKLLRLLRCEQLQGYLYGRPVGPEEMEALLRQRL